MVTHCGRPAKAADASAPSATVAGGGEAAPELPRTEWLLDGGEDESSWQVAAGVEGLTAEDGVLGGRASSDFPLVWAEHTSEVPDSEVLHAVEVRARVSAGRRLAATFDDAEERDRQADPLQRGLDQLASYLERLGLDHGALLIFDRRQTAGPIEERSETSEVEHQGLRIRLLRL